MMKNMTINYPDIYEENIQKLIKMKERFTSRSQTIRIAVKEFLYKEYTILKLLGYWEVIKK